MKNLFCLIFGWAWIALLFYTSPADMIFRVAFVVLVLTGYGIHYFVAKSLNGK